MIRHPTYWLEHVRTGSPDQLELEQHSPPPITGDLGGGLHWTADSPHATATACPPPCRGPTPTQYDDELLLQYSTVVPIIISVVLFLIMIGIVANRIHGQRDIKLRGRHEWYETPAAEREAGGDMIVEASNTTKYSCYVWDCRLASLVELCAAQPCKET